MTGQQTLVERADGKTVHFEATSDVRVLDDGSLSVSGPGYATVFAARAWSTATSTPSGGSAPALAVA